MFLGLQNEYYVGMTTFCMDLGKCINQWADPRGGRIGRAPPPPFFRPIFVFLEPIFVIFGRDIEEFGFPAPPPPLFFTDPGSASVNDEERVLYIYTSSDLYRTTEQNGQACVCLYTDRFFF